MTNYPELFNLLNWSEKDELYNFLKSSLAENESILEVFQDDDIPFIPFELVDEQSEPDGQFWVVFRYADKLYRMDGCYDSWGGPYFRDSDELVEVTPTEVRLVTYVPVTQAE